MIDSGILTKYDPVELLEQRLMVKPKRSPHHVVVANVAQGNITRLLPRGYHYCSKQPITLDDGEPEPDGSVIQGEIEDYSTRHPSPAETSLVIEVADSTLDYDRGMKLRSYARAGIPVYWIINLPESTVEVYTRPTSAGEAPTYSHKSIFKSGQQIPLILNNTQAGEVSAADLLP